MLLVIAGDIVARVRICQCIGIFMQALAQEAEEVLQAGLVGAPGVGRERLFVERVLIGFEFLEDLEQAADIKATDVD